jgi:hypothetical protein
MKMSQELILEHDFHFEKISNALNLSYIKNNFDIFKSSIKVTK